MTCPRCAFENPSAMAFCGRCGTRLAALCPSCGYANPEDFAFCGNCGTGIVEIHPPPRPATLTVTSPLSYTPKHLAERILTSKSALEGERKQVTVIFADLKGSMELLVDRDPEEARRLLDPVLERMMEAVHHYEGTVNQVMGDGIMALFGAPIGHEDHAVRACYAALRMQRRVALYADELQRGGGTPVQIRVGLNSGEVVVRAIGSDLRMDYTAVGQTTHLAARMEQMAKPGSVLATGDTLRLAEGYVQVRPLGSFPVKGLETPVPVYELTGTVPARSRFHATAARGLTRFVGRERELEHLGQALARAAAGHGQAVALVGEAGVGKSRLVWEVTHSHRTHGWLVLESGSVSYGKATPYLPVIDLLKTYCRIQERDDPRAIRERVAGKLLMLDRALEPLLTPLLALLDVPVEDAAWDALDPTQRRQRTLEAVKRLLLRESQVQPLLVVFEDLHWIDSESQALLDGLVESLPTARLLLLVNYRPEYQHAWGGKTYYLQLRLDPLPPQTAEEFLNALLGDDRTLGPLTQMLIARTEGNAFFLEESVRALVETQVLIGERGAYRLMKAPDAWQIPATAQAILAARIDRLTIEGKRLLQAASVIGKDVPLALLEAIADIPEHSLRLGLTHLQAAEFLYETSLFPDLEYTFKHAFTHEVAYGSLLQERRRALHARIVDAIEALYPDRLAEQVNRLAHHAVQGELWEKAVGYLRQAGTRAAARSASRAAIAWFEQALSALQRRQETRETQEQSVDLRFELRHMHYAAGELEKLFPSLREAERLARTLGDQRRLGWVWAYMGHHLLVTGGPGQARPYLQKGRDIGASFGDVELTVTADNYLGWACHAAGDFLEAENFLRRSLRVIGTNSAIARRHVSGRWLLAVSLGERGAFQEAITQAQEGVQLAEARDDVFSLILGYWGLGHVCSLKGDLNRAGALLERALALSRDWTFPIWSADIAAQLGYVYALSERVPEGVALVRQACADLESTGVAAFHSLAVAHLSEASRLADRLEDARAAAARARTIAREHGERGREADALRLLGDVAAHRERLDVTAADGHYSQALVLASELGMRPLMAHCRLGLGKLNQKMDDRSKAQEHLGTAAAMYHEMGMSFWLEQAKAAIGPPHGDSP